MPRESRILETLYLAPVLSNDPLDSIGMNWAFQTFVYWGGMSVSLRWKSAENKNLRRESE